MKGSPAPWFWLGLLASAGALGGCRRAPSPSDPAGEAAPDGQALKRSLGGLKAQLDELDTRFAALRKQVDAMPQGLPELSPVRASLHAVDERRRITDDKVMALGARLDAAANTGKRDDLQQVSRDIARTFDEIGQLNQHHVTLFHQVMGLQRHLEPVKD